jgi:hypothetical protein
MLEFPEIFYTERPDPLENGRVNRVAWIDAFVGNPPFLGGRRTSGQLGDSYSDWLEATWEASKNADVCAFFFRRTADLVGAHGAIGLLASNAISKGDTRQAALKPLLGNGFRIYDAVRDMPWPGEATVSVSSIHLAKGSAQAATGRPRLDGVEVARINSQLTDRVERADPVPLKANEGTSYQGSVLSGAGFLLEPAEREALIAKSSRNAERIRPFIGGEEINTDPRQEPCRFVIEFGDVDLQGAKQWPDLLRIVEERVKPQRDTNQ